MKKIILSLLSFIILFFTGCLMDDDNTATTTATTTLASNVQTASVNSANAVEVFNNFQLDLNPTIVISGTSATLQELGFVVIMR